MGKLLSFPGREALAVQGIAVPQQQPAQTVTPSPDPAAGRLTVHAVVKSFKKRTVVRGVSLELARGEAVGLLGPNGAGKTTVFYMITGLIPADEGSIRIDGRDVTKLPMYRRARLGIGYLPQEASIFRGLTVEENILAVLETVEPNKRERYAQLDALLEEFRITRLRKSPAMRLSGGERRRVEIARALATRPSFMLLDEPFAGIDPIAVGDIRTLVRHLTDRGIGVLITDHNVRETLDLVSRAYIIHDGMVLTHGTAQEIVNNEDVRRVYSGRPVQDLSEVDRGRVSIMAITTKLELRQTHALVMTPQLQQAIKLLQLSNLDLASFVESELERNPLLERDDAEESGGPSEGARHEERPETNGAAVEALREADAEAGDGEEWIDLGSDSGPGRTAELDIEPQDAFPDADNFFPGALKDSGWNTLGQGQPATDGEVASSRSLCRGGTDAARPSLRAACARFRRPGATADRSAPDRHDRRSRLSARRP